MTRRIAMKVNRTLLGSAILGVAVGLVAAGRATAGTAQDDKATAMKYEEAEKLVKAHLDNFDDLDYNVFTNQKWTELHRSHSQDVLVHWPDGHTTKGIEKHIQDLSAMFVWAPDTRIKVHTVKLGQGEWTAVIGIMEGTFSKPMPIGDGKFIQPTGKAYKIGMATIGHWVNGVMNEEYLFWDNQEFYKQIGLGK
jgi:hypothetical protein